MNEVKAAILFSIEHGDWYEDQKSGNIDNYLQLRIGFNPTSGKFFRHYVTLRVEISDGGFTADEIIDWVKSVVANKGLDLTDFKSSNWWGMKEYPEMAKAFESILMFTN